MINFQWQCKNCDAFFEACTCSLPVPWIKPSGCPIGKEEKWLKLNQ